MVVLTFLAIFRILSFMLILMVTSISSLFVGVNVATDRIASSWIEQSTGMGFPLGYTQTARDGLRAVAGMMLVLGWLLDIGVIYLLVMIAIQSQ